LVAVPVRVKLIAIPPLVLSRVAANAAVLPADSGRLDTRADALTVVGTVRSSSGITDSRVRLGARATTLPAARRNIFRKMSDRLGMAGILSGGTADDTEVATVRSLPSAPLPRVQ
jgi:hypothetical protein